MSGGSEDRSPWQTAANLITLTVAIGGALFFVLLRLYYNSYYGVLGVSANDVGLGYANTITNSVGLIIWTLLRPRVLVFLAFLVAYTVWRFQIANSTSRNHNVILAISILGVAFFLGKDLYTGRIESAVRYANEVKQGHTVTLGDPNRKEGDPFFSFIVRASPVSVKALDEKVTVALRELEEERPIDKPLLYLGQANNMIVIYDSFKQRSVFVPVGSVVISVINCEGQSPSHPQCKNRAAKS
jgi:hypothetical protein